MNGAQALIRTLVDAGVDVCFANPGTSEMHFVAALDDVPEMRAVLTLFEGVATGAADGYARMAGRPAATLLHLGPGLANGLANLHNARRAAHRVVNVVGDHARSHKRLDAPLESDIDAARRHGVRLGAPLAVAGRRRGRRRRGGRGRVDGARVDLDADPARPTCRGRTARRSPTPLPVRPAPRVAPSVVEEVAAVLALGRAGRAVPRRRRDGRRRASSPRPRSPRAPARG